MHAQNIMQTAFRGRWAVAAIFLANGFLIGSWAPHIPVFLTRLGISKFTLGLLILLFGVGAVAAMSWCGHLISRHGSRTVLRWFGLCGSFGLRRGAGPQRAFGGHRHVHLRWLDRRHGRRHECQCGGGGARLSRAIMSSSHGFWSLGGFAGGAPGGFAIQNYGHLAHAA